MNCPNNVRSKKAEHLNLFSSALLLWHQIHSHRISSYFMVLKELPGTPRIATTVNGTESELKYKRMTRTQSELIV